MWVLFLFSGVCGPVAALARWPDPHNIWSRASCTTTKGPPCDPGAAAGCAQNPSNALAASRAARDTHKPFGPSSTSLRSCGAAPSVATRIARSRSACPAHPYALPAWRLRPPMMSHSPWTRRGSARRRRRPRHDQRRQLLTTASSRPAARRWRNERAQVDLRAAPVDVRARRPPRRRCIKYRGPRAPRRAAG